MIHQSVVAERQQQQSLKSIRIRNAAIFLLYIFGLIICIPLSLLVWFARRTFFNETKVAGVSYLPYSFCMVDSNF